MSKPNFYTLPIIALRDMLIQQENRLLKQYQSKFTELKQQWQYIATLRQQQASLKCIESKQVDWLISLFNSLFAEQQVVLVRGDNEPEYFPAIKLTDGVTQPARIEFAHGFLQSALHEISHWCIAGYHRRTLSDFGYWYAADGRTQAQQYAFERVEIKPQAIECLFTRMCHQKFRVSQDNLNANFDTSQSTFAMDVFKQAQHYIDQPHSLPTDAKTLLAALGYLCHDTLSEH